MYTHSRLIVGLLLSFLSRYSNKWPIKMVRMLQHTFALILTLHIIYSTLVSVTSHYVFTFLVFIVQKLVLAHIMIVCIQCLLRFPILFCACVLYACIKWVNANILVPNNVAANSLVSLGIILPLFIALS